MITLTEGKPGEGMFYLAFFQALTGMSLSNYIEREIEFWFNSLPCRLTPAQAQTVLNAVLEKK